MAIGRLETGKMVAWMSGVAEMASEKGSDSDTVTTATSTDKAKHQDGGGYVVWS